jgi:hypothetical protein
MRTCRLTAFAVFIAVNVSCLAISNIACRAEIRLGTPTLAVSRGVTYHRVDFPDDIDQYPGFYSGKLGYLPPGRLVLKYPQKRMWGQPKEFLIRTQDGLWGYVPEGNYLIQEDTIKKALERIHETNFSFGVVFKKNFRTPDGNFEFSRGMGIFRANKGQENSLNVEICKEDGYHKTLAQIQRAFGTEEKCYRFIVSQGFVEVVAFSDFGIRYASNYFSDWIEVDRKNVFPAFYSSSELVLEKRCGYSLNSESEKRYKDTVDLTLKATVASVASIFDASTEFKVGRTVEDMFKQGRKFDTYVYYWTKPYFWAWRRRQPTLWVDRYEQFKNGCSLTQYQSEIFYLPDAHVSLKEIEDIAISMGYTEVKKKQIVLRNKGEYERIFAELEAKTELREHEIHWILSNYFKLDDRGDGKFFIEN